MFYEAKNPRELKDYILQRLGAPIIKIEITEQQVFMCIQRALELYGEYHYNGVNKNYIAIAVNDDEQAKNGVFDLSQYPIFAVTSVIRGNSGDTLTWGGGYPYPILSDLIMSLGGGGMGGSSCSSKAYGPNAYGADLSYYTVLMQYWQMMQNMLNPVPDYWFNDDTGQLKLMGNFSKGDVIILEVWTKSFVDTDQSAGSYANYAYATAGNSNSWTVSDKYNDPSRAVSGVYAGSSASHSQGAFNSRWVKDYATALVKELNGEILAKHQGMQLPGGTTVDGIRLIQEARETMRELREELDLLEAPAPILMG